MALWENAKIVENKKPLWESAPLANTPTRIKNNNPADPNDVSRQNMSQNTEPTERDREFSRQYLRARDWASKVKPEDIQPESLARHDNLKLLALMRTYDTSYETPNMLKKAINAAAGSLAPFEKTGQTGIRDNAYAELKRRGVDDNTIISALDGENPTFLGQLVVDAPEMIGGTVGGIGGSLITKNPLGSAALSTVVAAVGGAIGKGGQQIYRAATGDIRAPDSPSDAIAELSGASLRQGGAELAGVGGNAVIGKAIAPFAKKVIPGALEANVELMKRGAGLTPAQMTNSRLLDTLEGISENALIGSGKISDLKRLSQPAAMSKFVEDVSNEFSEGATKLTPEEAGTLLLDTISGKKQAFKAQANQFYKVVDDLTKGQVVNQQVSKDVQGKILDAAGKPVISQVSESIPKEVGGVRVDLSQLKKFAEQRNVVAAARNKIGSTEAGDTLLNKALGLDNEISWQQAADLRSAFLDEFDSMEFTRDKGASIAKQFMKITDKAMESAATKLKPEALTAWRAANEFYKNGQEQFNSKIIKGLSKTLKEKPELLVSSIFKPNASKQIRIVKDAVGQDAFNKIRSSYLEKIMTDATNTDGVLMGKSFLNKFNGLGDSALKEVFDSGEISLIRNMGNAAALSQNKTGGGGSMLVQLTQYGALANFAGGSHFKGTSAALVFTPAMLSQMLTNKKATYWLTKGLKTPVGTKESFAITARLAEEAARYSDSKENQDSLLDEGPTL